MEKESKYKSLLSFLTRPWFIETAVFFLVLWQESFRLSARTSHQILPVNQNLQNYYYYNFGDFVNGYIMAYIIDGIINFTLLKSSASYKFSRFEVTKRRSISIATLISISVVVVFELSQSTATTSDVNDIPAGVAGAILYYLIRLFSLKITTQYENGIK